MARIEFSDHAIERFRERIAPHLSYAQAGEHLRRVAPTATRMRERTVKGQDQWAIHDPDCILVTKRDKRQERIICLTVLPVEPEPVPEDSDEIP